MRAVVDHAHAAAEAFGPDRGEVAHASHVFAGGKGAARAGDDQHAKRVVLESLRFNKHVLRDVEAWLLPPEAEDCGCRIGSSAFAGFRAAAESAHLRFRIEPAS